MSTRWYPIYRRGNPQLRVYLSNFWMKLVQPHKLLNNPANVVEFHCSMEMTKADVKNYLQKIYGIYPTSIRTRIALGPLTDNKGPKGQLHKEDDIKIVYITLPPGETFKFPNLFPKKEKTKDAPDERKAEVEEYFKRNQQNAPLSGIPWFSR